MLIIPHSLLKIPNKNKSDYKKSLYIPKIEVFRAPEKVNQLLMEWNITNVRVLTENEFEEKLQRYSNIKEKLHKN